jgi:KUP system potassium uptake protein
MTAPERPESLRPRAHEGHPGSSAALVVSALGIVFGDIGTSPLYALRECITGEHGVMPSHDNVLGVLSLIVWSLTFVVTVKYLMFVMRAENGGEGGTLALLALVPERLKPGERYTGRIGWITLLVLAGTGLLYGDGMITPSISVLSAVEGLEAQARWLKPFIVPITCTILVGLFWLQRRGTAGIGRFFGPVMVVWFVTIGALGAWHLAKNPAVLWAIHPKYGLEFFLANRVRGFEVLGGVVLAVTGGEALYADMGHFGRGPIRIAWLSLVFPGLLLCYFGMGALVLANPAAAAQPFFALVPNGLPRYALVGVATAATVIASQALISGAFSVTQQAVQLGFFPRVQIRHTSEEMMGQIYVPTINWLLAIVCVLLVVSFQESARLAAAYGIAVTGSMAITSIVYFVVIHQTWGWSLAKAIPLLVFFLVFDLAFLGANTIKILDGGWVPLAIGAFFFTVMVVWKRGRRFLADLHMKLSRPLPELVKATGPGGDLELEARPAGTAVFLTSMDGIAPPTLVRHVERVRMLHEQVIVLTIKTARRPFVPRGERTEYEVLGNGFHRVTATCGFMQNPNVPRLLAEAKDKGLPCDLVDPTYFLGRETILGLPGGRMGQIEETFFAVLSRNARHAGQYFGLPPEQVVEIGTQVDL